MHSLLLVAVVFIALENAEKHVACCSDTCVPLLLATATTPAPTTDKKVCHPLQPQKHFDGPIPITSGKTSLLSTDRWRVPLWRHHHYQ
jgi:hypothetical protein